VPARHPAVASKMVMAVLVLCVLALAVGAYGEDKCTKPRCAITAHSVLVANRFVSHLTLKSAPCCLYWRNGRMTSGPHTAAQVSKTAVVLQQVSVTSCDVTVGEKFDVVFTGSWRSYTRAWPAPLDVSKLSTLGSSEGTSYTAQNLPAGGFSITYTFPATSADTPTTKTFLVSYVFQLAWMVGCCTGRLDVDVAPRFSHVSTRANRVIYVHMYAGTWLVATLTHQTKTLTC
jgi:hypothetical protein